MHFVYPRDIVCTSTLLRSQAWHVNNNRLLIQRIHALRRRGLTTQTKKVNYMHVYYG
jgi:hypothetical protein